MEQHRRAEPILPSRALPERADPVRQHRTKLVAVVLALAVGLPVLGCAGLRPLAGTECEPPGLTGLTPSDLVGTYAGRHAGTIELRGDGTFQATNLEDDDYERTTYQSGSGTWQLQNGAEGSGISLTFVEDDGTKGDWGSVYVAGTAAEPWLWYYYSDPDGCDMRNLTRTATSPATPTTATSAHR